MNKTDKLKEHVTGLKKPFTSPMISKSTGLSKRFCAWLVKDMFEKGDLIKTGKISYHRAIFYQNKPDKPDKKIVIKVSKNPIDDFLYKLRG